MADRTVVYRLRAELTQFRAQMAQGSASVKKFGDDLTAIDKEGAKTRRGLDTLGGAAGRVGLIAAAGFGAAVLKAANFDQAMSNVQAATHESTQNMEALRQAALDAGAQTVFSATESAAAIENLAKAGVATTDILGGGLQGALDLAAAGSLEVADAAEIAATALTQFGLSGEDVPHVADLLAAGAGKAQGEVTDLAFALKQSGLVAAQMGISIEETTGSLSAFASAGLLGSDAGTSFRTMLLRMANPTKDSRDLMDALGIAAYDLQGNFVGVEALAGQLQTAFEGKTQAERDSALATIFGSDAIRAANVLYEQGASGIQEWTNKVNDSGYAAETARTKLDNLKGDFEELTGSLETALIGTGSGSQGALRGITQQLTDVVNAYNNLPPAAQSAVGSLMAGSAILGGSIWVGAKLVRGIADTREALTNLGVSGDKAGRALKGVAVAGIAVAGIQVAVAGIKALDEAMSDAVPGTEQLTTSLLDLQAGEIEELGGRFDDLAGSIRRISDPYIGEHIGGALLATLTLGQLEGRNITNAREEIEALDTALAGLANSGSPELAASALAELGKSQGLTADEMERLRGILPEYKESLAGIANTERLTAAATEDTATATGKMGGAASLTADQLKDLEEALKDQREEATGTAQEFFNLGESLDKGKVSLRGWIRDLEKQAEALRDFRLNAEEAAKKGLDEGLIQSLQAAGPAGALRMKQLANATESEIERANKAWHRGQREIDRYVDATVKVPKALATTVTVATSEAHVKLLKLEKHLNWVARSYEARISITQSYAASGRDTYGGLRRAAGGPVYGPGSATSDSIPAWLSNGEFVIKADAVQKYGSDFFHKLNSMRFADGGMVARSAPAVNVSAGGTIDYDRLASAVLQARPVYGNVTVQPHNYSEFQRQMELDKRNKNGGGI